MGSIKKAFDLSGKSALITGGSRGLGLQIAEALGEQGAKIVLSSRKAPETRTASQPWPSTAMRPPRATSKGSPMFADLAPKLHRKGWTSVDPIVPNEKRPAIGGNDGAGGSMKRVPT